MSAPNFRSKSQSVGLPLKEVKCRAVNPSAIVLRLIHSAMAVDVNVSAAYFIND